MASKLGEKIKKFWCTGEQVQRELSRREWTVCRIRHKVSMNILRYIKYGNKEASNRKLESMKRC